MPEHRDPGDGVVDGPADDDASLDTPNCPVCLHRMEPDVTLSGDVYWACPVCGQSRIG